MRNRLNAFIQNNKTRMLDELFSILRLASISADSRFKAEVRKTAEAVCGHLAGAGLDNLEIIETAGHPLVYGEKILDAKLPTVLVYGHYDVQPPDPLDLWKSPPFEPVIRDEKIYARGANDDKGQVFMHIKALEFMIKENLLPCNVKMLIEGEEEVSSVHLGSFVQNHREKLATDVVLVSDSGMIANDIPSIMVGLRGLSYVEVEVTGPNRDLHSGLYGGAVANPAIVLSSMIASLIDAQGKVTVPGFYDDVVCLSQTERKALARAPFDLDEYKRELAIGEVTGEQGFSVMERVGIRPTLDVNGLWSGYTGEGSKTVLPAKASAKISMRLVPNQSSDKITRLFCDHFRKIAPRSVTVTVTPHHGGEPWCVGTDSLAYRAASLAVAETYGKEPIPVRGGGSIPIVALLEKELAAQIILLGFGLDSDAIHSPNEHFGVFNFLKGIETIPLFYRNLAELFPSSA